MKNQQIAELFSKDFVTDTDGFFKRGPTNKDFHCPHQKKCEVVADRKKRFGLQPWELMKAK